MTSDQRDMKMTLGIGNERVFKASYIKIEELMAILYKCLFSNAQKR